MIIALAAIIASGCSEPSEHDDGNPVHSLPEEAKALDNPTDASAESISDGAKLFKDYCLKCHGEAGNGLGPWADTTDPRAPALASDHLLGHGDGEIWWIIAKGSPGTSMPRYDSLIDEHRMWNIVNYIRSLANQN